MKDLEGELYEDEDINVYSDEDGILYISRFHSDDIEELVTVEKIEHGNIRLNGKYYFVEEDAQEFVAELRSRGWDIK